MEQFLPTLYSTFSVLYFYTTKWRKPGALVLEGLRVGADLWSPGFGLPGRRWGRLPQGAPSRDEMLCWSFKAGQPHNLRKSEPCSPWSINRPHIESDPFIFQVVCEKGKKIYQDAWAALHRFGGRRNFYLDSLLSCSLNPKDFISSIRIFHGPFWTLFLYKAPS